MILLLVLTFFVLLGNANAIEIETKMSTTGPAVCLSSSAVVTKYVNVMCEHRGILYVGGQFNRWGTQNASSFIGLNASTFEVVYKGQIGSRSLLEDIKADGEGNYFSVVRYDPQQLLSTPPSISLPTNNLPRSSMHCPEEEDYIYLGGMFRNYSYYTNSSKVSCPCNCALRFEPWP